MSHDSKEIRKLKRTLRAKKARRFLDQMMSNKMAMIGVFIILFFVLMAVIGPFILPFKTTDIASSREEVFNAPSLQHLLGTDNLGRDVFPLVFSETILIISSSILTETSLAFLGLGDPTRPSWGMMLNDAYSTGAMTSGAWWYFILPGVCVILVALGFTLMGYAFDEILNPKLKGR